MKKIVSYIESQEPSGPIREVLENLKPAEEEGEVEAEAEKGEWYKC